MKKALEKDDSPLVSVILPTFNRASTLRRAVMSVLQQSYNRIEVIVVDDGSTDDTKQVVASIADPRIRYTYLETNGGASRARNIGLRLAIGQLITFQDSDDEWLTDKLAKQVNAIRSIDSNAVCVFHQKIIYGLDQRFKYGPSFVSCVPILPSELSAQGFIDAIFRGNIISPQTLMLTRQAAEVVGPFDECLASSVDWDFAIRIMHRSVVLFLNEPLVMTYTQSDSISRNRRGAMRSQLRICLKLLRNYKIERRLLGRHFGSIGMGIAKLGNPRRGRVILLRAVSLHRLSFKNWLRLGASCVLSPLRFCGIV